MTISVRSSWAASSLSTTSPSLVSDFDVSPAGTETDVESMPALLKPLKGRLRIKDYEKMFCPDLKNANDVFDLRAIDREQGCLVIVRPDQYVANVLPLDGYDELGRLFAGILLPRY